MGVAPARQANRSVKNALSSPIYQVLARTGYVARGVLYGYMGYAAFEIARTGGVRKADQQSSLVAIGGFPLGQFILIAGVVAIGAYAIWGFVRAIYDPLHRGKDAQGIVTRLGFAWSGLSYFGLMFFAFGLLTHHGGSHPDATQQSIHKLLSAPMGVLLTEIAGVVGILAGLGQFLDAYRASFKKDEKRSEMSATEKKVTDALGRFGFIGRGIVFSVMGWFILLAARQNDPQQAKGFSGTFAFLVTQPYGRALLALTALGIIALGLHSMVLARYIRMERV